MKPCVVYARVSSKEQEREGYSIPAQLELLRKYAQANGFTVLHEFTEAETAKKTGRNQFAAMVDFIRGQRKAGKMAILVEKTDRLLRNLDDYVLISHVITDNDAEVHKVKENMVISRDSKSFELFIDGLNALLAKRYVDNLSEEVRKGRRQKVLAGGWHTLAPYGYKNDKNTRTIIPNPEQAPFVIRAFQLYATGVYSLEAVIEKLDKEGFAYRPQTRRIGRSKLHSMLQNVAYIGKIPFQGEVYDGTHPPLIDLETWRSVQLAFRKDGKPSTLSKRDFLYKGMITCGHCGSAIVGELKKGKYVYYRCSGVKNGCSQGYVPESRITETVEGTLSSLVFPEDAKQIIRDSVRRHHQEIYKIGQTERNRLEGVLKKLHNKRRAIYEDRLAGIIDADMYRAVDQDCLLEIAGIEAQKSQITYADTDYRQMADLAVELPEMLKGEWFSAEIEEKRLILNFLRSNFFLLDGNPLLELHPVFDSLKKSNDLIKKRK
jgi:DNA invertase Pin-like site-specific DNA recombinase